MMSHDNVVGGLFYLLIGLSTVDVEFISVRFQCYTVFWIYTGFIIQSCPMDNSNCHRILEALFALLFSDGF